MSQVGKLYLRKIWQKNWLRIIIFTLLIGVVWWFVIPWAGSKVIKNIAGKERSRHEDGGKQGDVEDELSFPKLAKYLFGGEYDVKFGRHAGKRIKVMEEVHLENREDLEADEKLPEGGGSSSEKMSGIEKFNRKTLDSANFLGLSFPFTADNVFFFQQTEGYNEGKDFWQLLFNISWWNLSAIVILYWFIFEVFDKAFFSSQKDGEDATVLTMTPGVKRSDLIWGKTLAFLTFYFLINIVIFLIPFGIYYFWLGEVNFSWFALLSLITTIVGPLLFFGLIFAPYLFFGSLIGGSKWIFSTLITFFPLLWQGLKVISSASWLRTVEKTFFDPVWFSIISLVCGIFFLTLYYLRYQEEDLN